MELGRWTGAVYCTAEKSDIKRHQKGIKKTAKSPE